MQTSQGLIACFLVKFAVGFWGWTCDLLPSVHLFLCASFFIYPIHFVDLARFQSKVVMGGTGAKQSECANAHAISLFACVCVGIVTTITVGPKRLSEPDNIAMCVDAQSGKRLLVVNLWSQRLWCVDLQTGTNTEHKLTAFA
jgi:hypothetical protein